MLLHSTFSISFRANNVFHQPPYVILILYCRLDLIIKTFIFCQIDYLQRTGELLLSQISNLFPCIYPHKRAVGIVCFVFGSRRGMVHDGSGDD